MPNWEPENSALLDLRDLVKLITQFVTDAHKAQLSTELKLRNLRDRLWATCRAFGMNDSEIARLSDLTPPAVSSVFKRGDPPRPLYVPSRTDDGNGKREETAQEALKRLGLDISDLSRAVAEHLRADGETG